MSAFLTDADYHWRRPVASPRVLAGDAGRLPPGGRDRDDVGGRRRRSRRGLRRVARAHPGRAQSGRSRGDRGGGGRAAGSGARARVVASGDRRRGPPGRRQELSAAARRVGDAPAYGARAPVHSRTRRSRSGAARTDRPARARRRRRAVRVSAESVEVHRARRRVRADVALRGLRQRARRSDGVRRAGGRDQLARDARDRQRRDRRSARRSTRARGDGGGARTRADRHARSGSDWRPAPGPARPASRCRPSPPRTTACSVRCWRVDLRRRRRPRRHRLHAVAAGGVVCRRGRADGVARRPRTRASGTPASPDHPRRRHRRARAVGRGAVSDHRSRARAVRQLLRRRGIFPAPIDVAAQRRAGDSDSSRGSDLRVRRLQRDEPAVRARLPTDAGRVRALRRTSGRDRVVPRRRAAAVPPGAADLRRDAVAARAGADAHAAEPVRLVDLRVEGAAVLRADRRRAGERRGRHS